jgi:ABC-2 type transport system ATP-binding protein
MKLMSSKELIISCSNPDEAANLFGDLKTKILGKDRVSITYDPAKIAVEKILGTLSSNQIHIKDISTNQPDLEEIFKHLVKSKA